MSHMISGSKSNNGLYTGETDNSSPAPSSSSAGFFKTPTGSTIEIRDVWASNLDEEMEIIRGLVSKYNCVAMDTEFPGVVAHPEQYQAADAQYQKLRCNVDLLKLIQLGLTFTDEEGNFVDGCTCWQFNFKFSLTDDLYAEDSIDMLKTSGIDFVRFEQFGIDIQYFGELMMMSGLVLNKDVKWLTFHSSFDFGYLLKTLTCCELPPDESGFMDLFHTYFPCSYDLKFMMVSVEGLYGGLAALADTLDVQRIGPMHQAGSDSLLTSQTYYALTQKHFVGNKTYAPLSGPDANPQYDDSKFVGELFGIGNSIYATASSTSQGTSTNTKYSISSEKEKEKSSAMSTIIKKLGQSYSTNPDGVNQNTNSYYSRSSSANNSSMLSQEQNLSDINYIMDKLKFRVDYASSQDDEYPASELDTHNPQTKGWQAQRFCEYPQELGLRIDSDRAVIKQIQILSHQFKISKKIELYIGQGSSYQTATFKRLGYMSLDDNTRSNFNARELKSVHIDDAGNFLKLILHQHHQNKPNIHGQVGIVAINLLGYKEGSGGLRDEPRIGRDGRRSDDRSPSSLVPNPLNDLSIDVGLDSHTAEKLRRLAQAKKKAVDEEDYMTAKQIKGVESELMKLGARLNQLDQVKRRAVQDEDYDRAAEIKQEVNGLRAEIEDKIAAICIPGVMDDPEPDYDDRRGRDNRRQGGHNAYSNHGGSGQKKKIINVDDQVVGGAGVYTDAVIDYSGTGNRGDNRGRGKVVQEEEVDFGDHHNYTNNDGSPQNRNSSNNNYNNNHNNNLQYDDDEGDFGPGGGMDTRPIRPKKRDLYDDVDPEMVGEEAAQQQMDQQGNDALFPPGQHPFEGLSNMNDLPPPEQFNAKAREVTDLSKVIDLIGEYRSRALFSTKSIPLREACLLKTRRMLEDGDFQSSPGYSAAIPALMSIIRVGADDRISQVYLSALSLLDTLLPYFKSEGFPKSEFAHLLEPVVATLVEKLNDGTTKIRESAMRMLKSLIGTTVVGPSVIAAQCLRLPGKQKTAWRPVCNRLQLILEIINVNGVSQRSGISVDGVLTFMKNNETFTHSNGEVRDVTKACCIALQRVVGTDAILPQLEPVLRKQQYDDYKIAFGESGGGSSGGGEDRNNGSPETSRSAGGGASHSSPHKSPQKIMQKGQAHEGGSSDDPASYTTCMFCNVHDPTWNEDGLDLHYWKDCTLLTQCPACSQVTEIAGLPQHLTQECEKKNDYVFDELTGLSVKRGEDLGLEPPPTNCAYCPLCIASVEDTDEAWLKHLSQVCPQNKRIVANQTTNDKLSHHADAKRSNSRPGTGRKVDSDAVAGAGMGGGSRPGTGTARPKSAKAVAEQVE